MKFPKAFVSKSQAYGVVIERRDGTHFFASGADPGGAIAIFYSRASANLFARQLAEHLSPCRIFPVAVEVNLKITKAFRPIAGKRLQTQK
jgi:hypothetical protein